MRHPPSVAKTLHFPASVPLLWHALSVRNVPFAASHDVQKVALNTHVAHDASHAAGQSLASQTPADAALVGEHPGGAPQADAVPERSAPVGRNTRPAVVDHRVDALRADARVVLDALPPRNTLCRVEPDITIGAPRADRTVRSRTLGRRRAHAAKKDAPVASAPEAPVARAGDALPAKDVTALGTDTLVEVEFVHTRDRPIGRLDVCRARL